MKETAKHVMAPRRTWGSRRAALLLLVMGAAGTLLLPQLRACRERGVLPTARRGAVRKLELTTIEGAPWRLEEDRGEVVAVNLWATWCGPCQAETPLLVRLSEELRGRGLRIVGVSLDAGPGRLQRVLAFAAFYHVSYPLAVADPLSQLDQAVEGIPTTLLFDREGRLAARYEGAVGESTFRGDVNVLLAEGR